MNPTMSNPATLITSVPAVGPPPAIDPETSAAGWRRWRRIFEAHARVTNLNKRDPEDQVAALITAMGLEAVDLYDSLPFASASDRKDLSKTLDLLEEHFVGESNVIYERYTFHCRQQEEGETARDYVSALRRLVQSCAFDQITPEEILRDRMVCGLRDPALRRSLLQRKNLTLGDCISEARSAERARAQNATIAAGKAQTLETAVHGLTAQRPARFREEARGQRGIAGMSGRRKDKPVCRYCGETHRKGECPAYGRKCNRCGRANHFARVCQQRASSGGRVNVVDIETDAVEIEGEYMMTVTLEPEGWSSYQFNSDSHSESARHKGLFAALRLDNHVVRFQLDTGASCNVLRSADLPKGWKLTPTKKLLRMYNGTTTKPLGQYQALVTVDQPRGAQARACFVVVDSAPVSLLGLETC